MIDIRATTRTSPLQTLRRILIVSLAVGSVLIGLLALHSMAGSHEGMPAIALGSAQHAHAADAAVMDGGVAMTASSEHHGADLPLIPCDEHCQTGCALIAMTCLLLIVLSAVVFLARYPAVFYRLIDSGSRATQRIPEARNHVYLPSLNVLSISRT